MKWRDVTLTAVFMQTDVEQLHLTSTSSSSSSSALLSGKVGNDMISSHKLCIPKADKAASSSNNYVI